MLVCQNFVSTCAPYELILFGFFGAFCIWPCHEKKKKRTRYYCIHLMTNIYLLVQADIDLVFSLTT